MMATGSSDPVTKSTKASWDTLIPELVHSGSDGEGGIFCKTQTAGSQRVRPWQATPGVTDEISGRMKKEEKVQYVINELEKLYPKTPKPQLKERK